MAEEISPIRVMIADDEEAIRLHLKNYLERRHCLVSVAQDGEQARKLLESASFDVILLDCSMPNITGLELVQLARRRNPQSKIVLISGFPAVNEEFLKMMGGDLFIHKPIQIGELDRLFCATTQEDNS